MKDERFDELAQIGYAVSMIIFCFLILLSIWLDNEFLMWISLIFFMYIPFMVCAIVIRYSGKERKRKKRKRERERRLMECKILLCRSCDRIYDKVELDISSTTIPRCPICDRKLTPTD